MPKDTSTPEMKATRSASLNAGITKTIRHGSVITKNKIDTHGCSTLLYIAGELGTSISGKYHQ